MDSKTDIVAVAKTDITSRDFVDVVFAGNHDLAKATRHFLTSKIANPHSRDNYTRSVRDFLGSCFGAGISLEKADTATQTTATCRTIASFRLLASFVLAQQPNRDSADSTARRSRSARKQVQSPGCHPRQSK